MFAPPRRFSQLATAFFALIRQGIHHKPFFRLTILLFPLSPALSSAGSNDLRYMSLKHILWSLLRNISYDKLLLLKCFRISLPFPKRVFLIPLFFKYQIDSSLGRGRVELPTPALSERCSNRLSYRP